MVVSCPDHFFLCFGWGKSGLGTRLGVYKFNVNDNIKGPDKCITKSHKHNLQLGNNPSPKFLTPPIHVINIHHCVVVLEAILL